MTTTFAWAIALAVATLAAMAVVRNRVIRRRLRFTLFTLAALLVLHAVAHHVPELAGLQDPQRLGKEQSVEQLLLVLGLISTLVALLFNPWFQDRVPDRSPAIVQDALVVAVFGGAAVYVLKDSTFLTASAIAAAAVGFALQDTLGNAFAGLAIQVEKPFRVGHWIAVANYEGAVAQVTWRATKIRTKAGNLVVIPNNTIAKEVINNYSEPAAPTRVAIDVGAAYELAPNDVRAAVLRAMRQAPRVLTTPAPEVLVHDFGASAVVYRARFWIADFAELEYAQDEVRRAIHYEFRRRNIEIPWPIQVEYQRHEPPAESPAQREAFLQAIAASPILAGLDEHTHRALAAAAVERVFGDGEAIVREGEPGTSMFLVRRGRVAVTIRTGAKEDAREVAVTESGGYFGEMSLLTGELRTATVTARGDCTVLEIDAEAFGTYVRSHPDVIDRLAEAAAARRRELDASRAAPDGSSIESLTLAQRIRKFFGSR
jgi:small-conductance mechanosensitive channel/CRP-like cAMP-binding protein